LGAEQTLGSNATFTLKAISSYYGSTSYCVTGQLDDIRVYNVALTATQVAELYTLNEDQEVTGATATAHYTFNDGPPTQGVMFDGEPVAIWESIEGNRHQFFQTNIMKRPTWVANSLNGRPAIRFDGVDDVLYTLSPLFTGHTGSVVLFGKLHTALDSWQYAVSQHHGTANGYVNLCVRAPNIIPYLAYTENNYGTQDTLRGNRTVSVGTPYMWIWSSSGSAIRLYLNTEDTVTVYGGANNGDWWSDATGTTKTGLGAIIKDIPEQFAAIDIEELVVYDHELTAAEFARCLLHASGIGV
jgi:hypothetical protein